MKERAALYIDGFNLYHSIDDINKPYLKWANYWRLAEIITPSASEEVVKVVYCTAFYPGNPQKKWRHQQFITAQKIHGVTVVEGHYVQEDMDCRDCGNAWLKPTEKEGDVNLAIHLVKDGLLDSYDHAYLLTADSDQAATAKLFRESINDKRLTTVSPPGRKFSVHIAKHAHGRIALSESHIERCVMGNQAFRAGVGRAIRPREYEPGPDWVHPDLRPG